MRHRLLTACAAVAATLISAAALSPPAAVAEPVAESVSAAAAYTWRNAEIVGGGFVPGIVHNRSEQGLVYARTDIGGAYRLDKTTKRWIPLLDWVSWDQWGWTGVASLATDSVDPNRVYAAVGTYTNSWDPNNGAILRSADRGATWQVTQLPFKVGGNMPGRGMGERLAVDPHNNNILYFGAPSGQGLWRSTDKGATWAKVTAFPNVGNYAQDPSDPNGYLSDNQGVTWVTFDPTTATGTGTTQTVYVGVADKQNTVYRTTNGGAGWERVPGQPTGYLAHKGVLDEVNHNLYLATSDTGGPYDGAKGDVWRFNTTTGAWTQVSPIPSSSADDYFGYSGLTVDRKKPGTLVVATQVSWWPDVIFFRSTDSGATWSRIWDWNGYPNRTKRYNLDISGAPWLNWGGAGTAPEDQPKLGWMTESVEIDPFDSNKLMYGTGATIYGTDNLTAWDTGGTVNISVRAQGLEETAVNDLISPPSGAPLISALGDIGGFRHDSLTTVPAKMQLSPTIASTTSLDYAELSPSTMVRVGNSDGVNIGISSDGGSNWYAGTDPAGVSGGGSVAISANAARIVWSPDGTGVQVSTNNGSSWTASTGVPAGARVEADRVDPNRFYAFSAGTFYVSANGGTSFTAAATGLPSTGNVRFGAVPGISGDVWLAGGSGTAYGLWHSTNAGTSFTRVSTVGEADNIGFGKAAPGKTYPALYSSAKIGGVRGIFRSDDAGATWARINDDQHQWGWTGAAITGDPRVYGRVYVSTNGRGIIYGDNGGATDPDPDPDPDPVGACSVAYEVTGQWQGGFQGRVVVKNTGTTPVNGWTLGWSFGAGQVVSQMWGASHAQSGAAVTATPASWNAVIAPGATREFGFLASWQGSNPEPAAFTLSGSACAVT